MEFKSPVVKLNTLTTTEKGKKLKLRLLYLKIGWWHKPERRAINENDWTENFKSRGSPRIQKGGGGCLPLE